MKDSSAEPATQAKPQFANIPLPEVTAHPHLSQTAKLVYGCLRRLSKINEKRGKDTFRIREDKLAAQIDRSKRTVSRAIRELRGNPDQHGTPEFDPLIVVVYTGRSSYYKLLPIGTEHCPSPEYE